ncbi:multiprotein-bridging factor 1a [Arachis duranensis]|uniref:Multiprotein-bridging factor 1a n=1 Tax=Arachis duranensis TaxID=130453 RepID=A0A9C6T8S1_ARADU|nr:multiprotein-bridging factor 1a [Arachis duranensis]
MSGVGPISQDWEPVVLNPRIAPIIIIIIIICKLVPDNQFLFYLFFRFLSSSLFEDILAGLGVMIVELLLLFYADNAGTNKAASSSTSLNTKRLDDDTENLAHERVPTELKKALMQARMDKKLTQAQLAQIINEKPQVIQEYESGKAIPNQQIIGKLERALGAKLRGKK